MIWSNSPFLPFQSDDTAHTNDTIYGSKNESFEAIETITEILKEIGIPIYPVLGNHDAYPHNQFPDDPNNDLYQKTGEIFQALDWPSEAKNDYLKNGKHFDYICVWIYRSIGLYFEICNFSDLRLRHILYGSLSR